MNTYEELVEEYGMSSHNATLMLGKYRTLVGSENGDYTITDITYVGDATKVVEETCNHCGDVIHRTMVSRRNKWSELQRICNCQREASIRETEERRKQRAQTEREEKQKERLFVLQNEIGTEYGEYVVVSVDANTVTLKCLICGAVKYVDAKYFMSKSDIDTLCHVHRRTEERFTDAYIGMKNNMLTVTGISHGKDGKKMFVCLCDCGRKHLVKPTLWESGTVKSCGCYQENRSIDADPVKRIKSIYNGMKQRCFNERAKGYENYGGRGIGICPEWMDVNEFVKWSLNNGYANTKTIDRIDPNGNYEPNNCRWTSYFVQNRNRRPRSEWKKWWSSGKTDR